MNNLFESVDNLFSSDKNIIKESDYVILNGNEMYMDDFVERCKDTIWGDLTNDEWNYASVEERKKLISPGVDTCIKRYGSIIKDNWKEFKDTMEYYNYHTELELLMNKLGLNESKNLKEDSSILPVSIKLEYTGGGVTLGYGKLSDGNFFTMQADGVVFYDADEYIVTNELDGDTYEWEQEHMIGGYGYDSPEFESFKRKAFELCDDSDKLGTDLFASLRGEDLEEGVDSEGSSYKVISTEIEQTGGYVYVGYGSLEGGKFYCIGSDSLLICDEDYKEAYDASFNIPDTAERTDDMLAVDGDMYDWEQAHVDESFDFGSFVYNDVLKQVYNMCDDSDKDDYDLFSPIVDGEDLDEDVSDEGVHVKGSNVTNGGYQNNADTLYGQLTDKNYFVFYTEMNLVEIYGAPVDDLLIALYDNDEEASQEVYNTFHDNYFIKELTSGPLYDEIHNLYFKDDSEDIEESSDTKDLKSKVATWLEKDLDTYRDEWNHENKNMASWAAKDLKIGKQQAWNYIDKYFTEEYFRKYPNSKKSNPYKKDSK